MSFLVPEGESHSHDFIKLAAPSTGIGLRLLVTAALELDSSQRAQIFGPNSNANLFLYTRPQPQPGLLDEVSALAICHSNIDYSENVVRVSVSYLSTRKDHAQLCMDDFLKRIEDETRAHEAHKIKIKIGEEIRPLMNKKIARKTTGILTIVAGNIDEDIFTNRGYAALPAVFIEESSSAESKDRITPDIAPAFQLPFRPLITIVKNKNKQQAVATNVVSE